MRFSGGPEIGFPRAAASIVNLLSVLFRSLRLCGRVQSLFNSNISLPFLSVLTGRGGYSLGGLAGAGSWKCWPEAFVTGIRACQGGSSMTLGRAGGGAAAAAGLHLALDWALRQPLVLVEHWEAGVSLSSMGEDIPVQILYNFLFYHQSIFVPLIFSLSLLDTEPCPSRRVLS